MFWQRFSFPFSMWITGLFCDVCTVVSTCVGKWCVLCVFRFCLHLSPSPPMSFNSWLCMSCHSWNRRTSSRQPRHVDTGASWQKTTCCGGRNARKRVSLNFKQRHRVTQQELSEAAVTVLWLCSIRVCLNLETKINLSLFVHSFSFHVSANRHWWAAAPQEEENSQAWLHAQPLEECLHQATQNRH